MMDLCAVVIPIYKDRLSSFEEKSLKQCVKILSKYQFIFVSPHGLDMREINTIMMDKKYIVEFFNNEFFVGVEGYNRLMMTKDFYRRFYKRFEYILIYQLDCFVFCDQLTDWCHRGYDYVGAPWFINCEEHKSQNDLWICGNGGFSLRKVSYFLKVLSWPFPFKWKVKLIAKRYYVKLVLSFLKGTGNVTLYELDSSIVGNQEDVFFSYYTRNTPVSPNIPSAEVAMSFAFEKSPSYLYELNNHRLPFGCHAFHKWEYDSFWKKIIN